MFLPDKLFCPRSNNNNILTLTAKTETTFNAKTRYFVDGEVDRLQYYYISRCRRKKRNGLPGQYPFQLCDERKWDHGCVSRGRATHFCNIMCTYNTQETKNTKDKQRM